MPCDTNLTTEVTHALVTIVSVVTGGWLASAGQRTIADLQERRRLLREQHEGLCALLLAWGDACTEAFRGSLEPERCEARKREILTLRSRALLALGNESFANELMGIAFENEAVHRREEQHPDMSGLLDGQKRAEQELVRVIRETRKKLEIPELGARSSLDEKRAKLGRD